MVAESSGGGEDVRRFVLTEMVASGVINGCITAFAAWLTFAGRDPVPVWGGDGVAFDLLPSTFIPVALMGLILPFVIAMRRRVDGRAPQVSRRDLDRWLGPLARIVRWPLAVRAPLLALVWSCLFVPVGGAALWIMSEPSVSLQVLILSKGLWGVAVGASVCPLVVLPAAAR